MIPRHAASRFLVILAALFMPETGRAQTETSPGKKVEGAMVRIVCVRTLSGGKEEEITLANKKEDGEWSVSGDLTLRSPGITGWLRVPHGTNNIVRKEADGFVSLGSFNISPDMKGTILILIPEPVKKSYRLQVVDPAKLQFRKGKALVMNYSTIPASLNMGKETKILAPGQQFVATIRTDRDGMHPMLIGYHDKDRNFSVCYDRRISSNPNTRTFILIFPDPETGLHAMTFTEFGPFE